MFIKKIQEFLTADVNSIRFWIFQGNHQKFHELPRFMETFGVSVFSRILEIILKELKNPSKETQKIVQNF